MAELKYDPAKVNAKLAENEAEVERHDAVAQRLRDLADDEEREASRYRGYNVRLREMLTETVPESEERS